MEIKITNIKTGEVEIARTADETGLVAGRHFRLIGIKVEFVADRIFPNSIGTVCVHGCEAFCSAERGSVTCDGKRQTVARLADVIAL